MRQGVGGWKGGMQAVYLPPALLILLQPGIAAHLAQDGALQGRRGLAGQAEGGHLIGWRQAEGILGVVR